MYHFSPAVLASGLHRSPVHGERPWSRRTVSSTTPSPPSRRYSRRTRIDGQLRTYRVVNNHLENGILEADRWVLLWLLLLLLVGCILMDLTGEQRFEAAQPQEHERRYDDCAGGKL